MDKGEIIVPTLIGILTGLAVAGFISCFVMGKKEEHCLKECKRLSQTSQVWMPKLCPFENFNLGAFLLFLIMPLILLLTWAIKGDDFWLFMSVIILISLLFTWALIMILNKTNKYPITYFSYPLFAIVNDELIVWEYMGFGKRKVYKLSELSRNKGEIVKNSKVGLVFTLYNKENVPVVYIRYDAYKKAEEITQMLKKIPVV